MRRLYMGLAYPTRKSLASYIFTFTWQLDGTMKLSVGWCPWKIRSFGIECSYPTIKIIIKYCTLLSYVKCWMKYRNFRLKFQLYKFIPYKFSYCSFNSLKFHRLRPECLEVLTFLFSHPYIHILWTVSSVLLWRFFQY